MAPKEVVGRRAAQRSRSAGPFVRVLEDRAVVTDATDTLAYHVNGYLADGRARVRPSLARLGTATAFGAAVTGSPVQCVASARSSTGASVNVLVAGGVVYVGVGTVPSTVVDLTGITLSSTARHIYAVSFANYLIISDGVNRPCKVHLATLVASLLTGFTYPAYGAPVVYYGKLFFIRADKRTELMWSEERDPDTGYDGPCAAGGNFKNYWELQQTDQDPLEGLLPTNDALVYWRGNNVGVVQGAVTPEFQSTGTHDAVSSALGTRSPGSLVRAGRRILFVDQRARLCLAELGGTAAPVSEPAVYTGGTARAALADIVAAVLPELERVLVAHPAEPAGWLVFNPNGPQGEIVFEGRWTWATGHEHEVRAMGPWLLDDRDDIETLVVGDEDGFAWGFLPALPAGGIPHVDYTATPTAAGPQGPAAFTRTVRTGALMSEPRAPKRFDLALVEVSDPPVTASGAALAGVLVVDYTTSDGANPGAVLEVAPDGAAGGELGSVLVGLDGFGRWIAPEVRTAASASAYDVVRVSVEGERLGDQPEGR